jgi:YebC/PmpR family DNA-binding regulatory protein
MSGHSKWHTIKHKKGALDAKRGKLFTRLIKEMTVAARNGGGDINMNPRLRTVVAEAKAANMPAENIKRAIQRGTGELPGVTYEEINYEGYGPGGAAIIIETMTDNKNRTVGEIRHMLANTTVISAPRTPSPGCSRRRATWSSRSPASTRRHSSTPCSRPAPTTCATMATTGK